MKSRRVHIAGIAEKGYGKWTEQVARSLTDPSDGFLRGARYLIHDLGGILRYYYRQAA